MFPQQAIMLRPGRRVARRGYGLRGLGDVVIRELGEVSIDDLSGIIDASGFYDTVSSDPLVKAAQARWWLYSVNMPNIKSGESDGTVRITKRNLLLYGGLALGGLLLLTAIRR